MQKKKKKTNEQKILNKNEKVKKYQKIIKNNFKKNHKYVIV